MDFKSTIFIFGTALIFILPLVISAPRGRAGGRAKVRLMEMCNSPYTTITRNGTTITSPNWPKDNYPNDKDCETTIKYPTGKRVSTQFDEFYVDEHDYLEIRDGDTKTSPLIISASGDKKKFKVESSSTAMTLHFHSGVMTNDKGFTSIAKQMRNSACTLSSNGLKNFKEKHVNENAVNAREAATTSCNRNLRMKKSRSGTNSVLFLNHQTFSLFNDDTIVDDHCQASFPDVWQCRHVPMKIGSDPADLTKCISDTEKHCRPCKSTFPSASGFEVEVDKDSGHLFYKTSWYTDKNHSKNYKLKHALDLDDC